MNLLFLGRVWYLDLNYIEVGVDILLLRFGYKFVWDKIRKYI